jgi:hypothetical protein
MIEAALMAGRSKATQRLDPAIGVVCRHGFFHRIAVRILWSRVPRKVHFCDLRPRKLGGLYSGLGLGPADFVICSWRINDAKNDLDFNEFRELCAAVLPHTAVV